MLPRDKKILWNIFVNVYFSTMGYLLFRPLCGSPKCSFYEDFQTNWVDSVIYPDVHFSGAFVAPIFYWACRWQNGKGEYVEPRNLLQHYRECDKFPSLWLPCTCDRARRARCKVGHIKVTDFENTKLGKNPLEST